MTKQRENQAKTKTVRVPKYSRAEGLAVVERWKKSGLSLPAFCRRHQLSLSRLRYWANIAKQTSVAAEPALADFFVLPEPESRGVTANASSAGEAIGPPPSGNAIIVVVPVASFGKSLRSVVRELGL